MYLPGRLGADMLHLYAVIPTNLPWMFHNSEKHNVTDCLKKILSARLMPKGVLLVVNLCIQSFSFISLISFAFSKHEKYTCMSTCRLETYPFFST